MNRLARKHTLIVLLSLLGGVGKTARADLLVFPERPADPRLGAFKRSIDKLHDKAMRSPKPWSEVDLRKRVARPFESLEKKYRRLKKPEHKARTLAELALLYADLAWAERIRPIADELVQLDPALAAQLGHFGESDHFFVRVVGTESRWVEAALKLAEAARSGYLEVFGFERISKVPGKKIRILIHVDPGAAGRSRKRARLYFNPSPRYYGEFRYEIPDETFLTLAGRQRIVYGFCHELGHMVAMWGTHGVVEDDKHAWAHYTGCLIVEEVYKRLGNEPWPTWTAFQRRGGVKKLLGQIEGHESGTESYESILALFHAIGEEFGREVYGKAWKWLELKKRFRKVNEVSYLWLRDLEEALASVVPKERAARVAELFKR